MSRYWLSESEVNVADLAEICNVVTELADYPHAKSVEDNVLVYNIAALDLDDSDSVRAISAEWFAALDSGPGVIALKGAFADTKIIDDTTAVFESIIEQEKLAHSAKGDHFGKPGANARIWNAQEKLARANPGVYTEYFANRAIAIGSKAWLGPNYQMTSQVNLVYPGGQPQEPHRDYHLGFMSIEQAARYPDHIHQSSRYYTLQGAVAHCDMPVESGPTMLLPHSQKYSHGYLAWQTQDIKDYFAAHMIQLPLEKGDVIFFNPALIHGAGENKSTDIARMANLLQVSSAFGRAMETLDRTDMCEQVFATLREHSVNGTLTRTQIADCIAATAEGYPFPTNLDNDQPVGGMTPQSQAELMHQALNENWSEVDLRSSLQAQNGRRQASMPDGNVLGCEHGGPE